MQFAVQQRAVLPTRLRGGPVVTALTEPATMGSDVGDVGTINFPDKAEAARFLARLDSEP